VSVRAFKAIKGEWKPCMLLKDYETTSREKKYVTRECLQKKNVETLWTLLKKIKSIFSKEGYSPQNKWLIFSLLYNV